MQVDLRLGFLFVVKRTGWVLQLTELRRNVLGCRHNDYVRKQLLYLGTVELGSCHAPFDDDACLGEDRQIFIKTPLMDNWNYIYCRASLKMERKQRKRTDAHKKVVPMVSYRPTPEALGIFYHSPDAITSCGFEMRWSLERSVDSSLVMHPSYWASFARQRSRENFEIFFGKLRDARQNPPSYKLNVTKLPISDNLYYFPYLGLFVRDLDRQPYTQDIRGGILADEMGLGKTVELLALILTHTPKIRPEHLHLQAMEQWEEASSSSSECSDDYDDDDDYMEVRACVESMVSTIVAAEEAEELEPPRKRFCDGNGIVRKATRHGVVCELCTMKFPKSTVHWSQQLDALPIRFVCPVCIADRGLIFDISATLIVVPEALLHQWFEEIRRHCRERVVVDVYYGVGVDGYKHPAYLNSCDIVLCYVRPFKIDNITTNPSSLKDLGKHNIRANIGLKTFRVPC
ncbi:hypothetical protein COOONC_03101 [Cooperia oncophora]